MSVISLEIINSFIIASKKQGNLATKDLEDRHYTTGELYELRLLFTKILSHINRKYAWRTKLHYDGTMFNDSFLVGITTTKGEVTFHFRLDYYDEFDVPELARGPKYDGYEWPAVRERLECLASPSASYIETDRSVIYNPDNKVYIEWFKALDSIEKVEDMKRYTQAINGFIRTLRNEGLINLNDISDGNHTFNVLYEQRRTLLRQILYVYPDLAWKSFCDINGAPIDGGDKFLVGLYTALGPVGFVMNNSHYDYFDVEVIKRAPLANGEVRDKVFEKLASIKIRERN